MSKLISGTKLDAKEEAVSLGNQRLRNVDYENDQFCSVKAS